MLDFQNWGRRMRSSISASARNFMAGRYGPDRLTIFVLLTGFVASILSSLLRSGWLALLFWALSYGLMIWAISRCLSRNTYKRYQENRKFLLIFDRLKDRQHRYYDCPRCRQTVRVPRGKGKIAITCPRCREVFQRKT